MIPISDVSPNAKDIVECIQNIQIQAYIAFAPSASESPHSLRLVILITSWKDRYHAIDDHKESGPGLTNFRNTNHCISSPAHFQKREIHRKKQEEKSKDILLCLHLCLTYFRFAEDYEQVCPYSCLCFVFFWGDAEVERVMQMVE